jgi:hypothetical protein
MKKRFLDSVDDLRPEYDFDFKSMRPNPYAKQLKGRSVISIVLDDDVARVFHSSEVVNDLLRSVIKAMPKGRAPAGTSKRHPS